MRSEKGVQNGVGEIAPSSLYRLDEIQSRSGMGNVAIRTMRRQGLPVLYMGGRGYILGEDFISHVRKYGKSAKGAKAEAVQD